MRSLPLVRSTRGSPVLIDTVVSLSTKDDLERGSKT